MGLFTKSKLGDRYDLFDWTVRTWHCDRTDFHSENEYGSIWERCKVGRNSRESNPNFIFEIYENREWNPGEETWEADGRFVIDFVWPWDSDAEGRDVKECYCELEDLKTLADFIYNFLDNHPSWGHNNTTQTKTKEKHKFNSQYNFNYYIDDREKFSEKLNFDFSIEKYDFYIKAFEIKTKAYQWSKAIDQPIDIIMSPLQLKEFADFIYNTIS